MNDSRKQGVFRTYLQFALVLGGVAAILVLIGYGPTRALGGERAIRAMFLGCGLSLLASALGAIPQALAKGRTAAEAGNLFLMSLGVRMGVALLGALTIVLTTSTPQRPFLLWVAISYLIFLAADIPLLLTRQRND